MSTTHLMIQSQYQIPIQMQLQIQTPHWPQSQSHSHPAALMGLEVKLEEQVLCGTLVCNSHSPMTYRRGVFPQIRMALNVRQKAGMFNMLLKTVIRKQTHLFHLVARARFREELCASP